MNYPRYLLFLLSATILFAHSSFGQADSLSDVRAAFMKSMVVELKRKIYELDSEAGAAVLFENRKDQIHQENGTYYLVSNEQIFIKIFKQEYTQLGNVDLYFHVRDPLLIVNSIRAASYNLIDTNVVVDSVRHEDILIKKMAQDFFKISFSIPNVKEGSVIYYAYGSAGLMDIRLPQWNIQGSIPKMYSHYQIVYPSQLELGIEGHVKVKMWEARDVSSFENNRAEFCHIRNYGNYPFNHSSSLWIRKNVPAFKQEPYVSNYQNEIEEFRIVIKSKMTPYGRQSMMTTWGKINDQLMQDEDFGRQISAKNKFLNGLADSIRYYTPPGPRRIRAAYEYVRNNIAMDSSKRFSLVTDLKAVFEEKKGNVTDKNMLLIALLRQCDVDAYPMLLATTERRSLDPDVADTNKLNYLVCAVKQGYDNFLLLDAYDRNNFYGELPFFCYNGYSRIVADTGISITIVPGILDDNAVMSVVIDVISDSMAKIEIVNKPGKFSSYMLRERFAHDEKIKGELIESVINSLDAAITIDKSNLANFDNPDTSIVITCSGTYRFQRTDSEAFINTAWIKAFKQNPFIAIKRTLPIEFSGRIRYVGNMRVSVPKMYKITDAPKSASLSYEDNRISFERVVDVRPDKNIVIRSVYTLNDTQFMASEYGNLRNFFRDMLDNDNDIIALKKGQ